MHENIKGKKENKRTNVKRENENTYQASIAKKVSKPGSSTVFALETNPNGTSQDLGSSESRFNMEVYSVRVYNRYLTEEREHNYKLDKERYGI